VNATFRSEAGHLHATTSSKQGMCENSKTNLSRRKNFNYVDIITNDEKSTPKHLRPPKSPPRQDFGRPVRQDETAGGKHSSVVGKSYGYCPVERTVEAGGSRRTSSKDRSTTDSFDLVTFVVRCVLLGKLVQGDYFIVDTAPVHMAFDAFEWLYEFLNRKEFSSSPLPN